MGMNTGTVTPRSDQIRLRSDADSERTNQSPPHHIITRIVSPDRIHCGELLSPPIGNPIKAGRVFFSAQSPLMAASLDKLWSCDNRPAVAGDIRRIGKTRDKVRKSGGGNNQSLSLNSPNEKVGSGWAWLIDTFGLFLADHTNRSLRLSAAAKTIDRL